MDIDSVLSEVPSACPEIVLFASLSLGIEPASCALAIVPTSDSVL